MPERFGRYTVDRQLGAGGMGAVYLAYTPGGDPVAIKVIRSDRLDYTTRARFEREAMIAKRVIGTSRVARFLGGEAHADQPWLAMEYVPGDTLLKFVDTEGTMPAVLVASMGLLLTEGLEAVHEAGLTHRDLKPQNIILSVDGPRIIDFGLAAFADSDHGSLSQSGAIIGTIRCMPPEQARGNPRVTAAADVYALGTVLLYAAAGHYPFDGTNFNAIHAQVTSAERAPDLTGVPDNLLSLVTSMLAYEEAERPALDDVAGVCAGVLECLEITAAEARRALIRQTAQPSSADTARALTPSIEDLLQRAEQADEASLISPSDSLPSGEAPVSEGPSGERSEAAPELASAHRTPVTRKVSEDLRRAYALQTSL